MTHDPHFLDLRAGWHYWLLRGEFSHDAAHTFTNPEVMLDDLRARLCEATAKLNRWGGWSEAPVSVARHSLIVAAFAYARAEALGWPGEKIAAAVAEAAVHDLHEPLGLGDVLSPVLRWLRETCAEPVDVLIAKGEAAVRGLFGLPAPSPEVYALRKLADHDAAAVERGYACDDAPDWLGPRQALAEQARGQHSLCEGILGRRLLKVLRDPILRIRREMSEDWLLRRLGFDTPEGRRQLLALTVPG